MEPRAKLRLDRLEKFANPFVGENVKPFGNLQFNMDELNVLSTYETGLNDYMRTNLIKWLMKGGVSEEDWNKFQKELTEKVYLNDVKKVYQDAYTRSLASM
jgi:putative aldouronate transport system substrate-binding protein